jgi:hypothetical protein
MNYSQWVSYWGSMHENQPLNGRVHWKRLPGAEQPVHLHTSVDYALNRDDFENPAIGAASDGSDAGVQAGRLLTP